jgi:hypothetical protein
MGALTDLISDATPPFQTELYHVLPKYRGFGFGCGGEERGDMAGAGGIH